MKAIFPKVVLTVAALSLSASLLLQAETIDWVTWTPSTSPGTTSTGAGSSLTVNANWTVRTNITFANRSINLTDPTWPFSNQNVGHMWLSQAGTVLYNNVTIDFTSPGGLAAGGSIGFVDIDNTQTYFTITAYLYNGVEYVETAVDWSYATYKNVSSNPVASWNPTTNTIKGEGGGSDVFSFLTSNVRIDRIVLNGRTVDDGWGFAASSTSVPEPSVIALSLLGGAFLALRRRVRN